MYANSFRTLISLLFDNSFSGKQKFCNVECTEVNAEIIVNNFCLKRYIQVYISLSIFCKKKCVNIF